MPYMKVKEGEQVCVYKKGTDGQKMGKSMGCHASDAEADKQIAALHANVKDGERRAVLQQSAVNYVTLSEQAGQACANCLFYHARDDFDTCAIVHDWPLAIQNTGWCNRWEALPEVIGEDSPTLEVEMKMDNMEDLPMEDESRGNLLNELVRRLMPKKQAANWWDNPTGFRMLDNGKWMGWYSNNFRDYYGTIFAEQGFDDYIFRLESHVLPMPELRAFHTPGTEHGRATKVFRAGHFVIAVGEFYPDTEREQAYYRANQDKLSMSHGFYFDPEQFLDGVFYAFNTFEVSTLPHEHAGNPYTYFMEVRTMSNVLAPEVRTYLVDLMGEDKVTELEQVADARGHALEQNGAQYRNFDTRNTEQLKAEIDKLNERLDAMQQAAEATPEPIAPELDTTVTDELAESMRTLVKRVDAMDTFLKDKFRTRERASQSEQTIVDAADVQLQVLRRMNEQPNPQKSFVDNMRELYRGAPIEHVDPFPVPPTAPPTIPTEPTS